MNSTGNDIVSLNAIDITRSKQRRFYSKILADSEIAAYGRCKANITFENFVWLAWSVKESAYKFLKRNNPELVFSPTKCIVSELEADEYQTDNESIKVLEGIGFDDQPVFKSIVTVGSVTLYSRSIVSRDFIFSIVSRDDDFKGVGWGVKLIDDASSDNQSAEVRGFLLENLAGVISSDNLQIAKNVHGCPVLVDAQVNIPISLAHHNNWVAYSYQLEPAIV